MISYEFFIDNVDSPLKATLIECFPSDTSQKKHLDNIRADLFFAGLSNPRITVLGNIPQTSQQRMLENIFSSFVFRRVSASRNFSGLSQSLNRKATKVNKARLDNPAVS